MGKKKAKLDSSEVSDVLDDGSESEQMDRIYDSLEALASKWVARSSSPALTTISSRR